jgi:hypothetical protein
MSRQSSIKSNPLTSRCLTRPPIRSGSHQATRPFPWRVALARDARRADHGHALRQSRSKLLEMVSRAGRNSGWPPFSLPTHREVVAAASRISALGAPHTFIRSPRLPCVPAACLHSTPPRYRISNVLAEGYTRAESPPSALVHKAAALVRQIARWLVRTIGEQRHRQVGKNLCNCERAVSRRDLLSGQR